MCRVHYFKKAAHDATGKISDWMALAEIFEAQGARCAYTGAPLVLGVNASVDHIVPRTRGGGDELRNLHWTTLVVNRAKRELTEEEFFALCAAVCAMRTR